MSETGAFPLPSFDYDGATPEQANQELNRLNAELGGSIDRHPLASSAHMQHKDFIQHREKVMDVARRGMDTRPESEKILQAAYDKGQARMAEKREQLVGEKRALEDKLKQLGFGEAESPLDDSEVEPFVIRGLNEQVLLGEEKYDDLRRELAEDVRKFPASHEVHTALKWLSEAQSPETKFEIADRLIRLIYDTNRQKAAALSSGTTRAKS